MGNQILKSLKMSSDVTDWHEVAAGRGSVCNWMMEGLDISQNSVILGRGLSKGVYLQNENEIFWVRINTA